MQLDTSPPPAISFAALRGQMGWGRISEASARTALSGSLFTVSIYGENNLAGFGRVVGDGALNFYIQDVMVDERYRGSGLGRQIMENLLTRIKAAAPGGATIGLMSASGMDGFYKKFGFTARPNAAAGSGMTLIM